MPTFRAAVTSSANKPRRVVSLPPSSWAHDYHAKSTVPVDIGLRLYSEAEAVQVRAAAAQRAWKLHPEPGDEEAQVIAWNGIAMTMLVARATCYPTDTTISFFGREDGALAEEQVAVALTPGAIEFLFGELDALITEESPIAPEAGDEDLAWLAAALAEGKVWGTLPGAKTRAARRMIARALLIMRGEE